VRSTLAPCRFRYERVHRRPRRGLYAHFLGILTVEMFYMDLNFISIAVFVFGGASSVTGAAS
jgi:hypothetical protein